jgi:hypothetical protein
MSTKEVQGCNRGAESNWDITSATTTGTPGPFALSEDGKIESVLQSVDLKMRYKTSVSNLSRTILIINTETV